MTILNKEKILDVARAFIDEGRYDKAIREYEKILLAEPGDLRVKLRIAELYTKRKQIAEAIRLYREVAEAYAVEGFYLKAVTVQKNILRLNPSLNETNEQLAILYEKMGLVGDAIRQYDILASSLDLKGQAERVLEIRNKIVKLDPKDVPARIKLAEIYQREGRMEEAIDQYEELARQVEESGGDKLKLADLYEKILAHRPDRHALLRKLITLYDTLGDHKKALKCMEAGKELVERDAELLAMMARIYAAQNQNETARSKYLLLAELHEEAGAIDAALDAFGEILVLLPDEEDRLARRVEELKPGALAELVARAGRRREELEQEETRRQQEEEAAREAEKKAAEEAAQQKAGGRRARPAAPAAAPPQAPSPQVPSGPVPDKAPEAPPPATKPKGAPDRFAADAAFDLGLAYRRMGLDEEASAEFAKAREIYAACLDAGVEDPDIAQRLTQIDASAAGEPVRKAEPATRDRGTGISEQVIVSREQAPEGKGQGAESGERKPAEEKKPEEKKKKVSFV